jgi:hypothetical protein
MPILIDRTREHTQQNETPVTQLNDLGNASLGFLVTNDDRVANLQLDPQPGVPHISARQPGTVSPLEIHSQLTVVISFRGVGRGTRRSNANSNLRSVSSTRSGSTTS